MDVFSNDRAETLAQHQLIDHTIDLDPGFNIPYVQIYNLSEVELRTLKAYMEPNQDDGFIHQWSSPVAALILFAMRMEGGLWLCVDYQALNRAQVKN